MLTAILRVGVLSAAAIFLTVGAYAQNGAIRGTVTVKESADAAPVPRKDVQIVILRQDIKGRYTTKTDKRGEFFYSVPAFSEYVVAAFGPGLKYKVLEPFKVQGGDPVPVKIELVPGDGATPTDAQINTEARSTGSAAAAPTTRELTAEEKAENAKLEAEKAKILENNKKITENNASVKKHLEAGNAAYGRKEFEVAISEYRAGIEIDPLQDVFWGNISSALFQLAASKFNAKQKDEAKKLFGEAGEAGMKAYEIEQTLPAEKRGVNNYKKKAADSFGALGKYFFDSEGGKKAAQLYLELSQTATTPKDKATYMLLAADNYRYGNILDQAETLYREVLKGDPENLDGMSGLAVTLLTSDPEFTNKEKAGEALTLFETVASKATNAQQKQDATTNADYIRTTAKELVRPGKKKKG